MRNAFVLVAALAVVSAATATVRVFVTPASAGMGLDNPANAFQPTFSTVTEQGENFDAYDYYHGHFTCSSYPTLDTAPGTVEAPVEVPATDFGYIWLRFESERSASINGLKIVIREVGQTDPAEVTAAWYVQNDYSYNLRKRWDGTATPPGYAEWHSNPQAMVAVLAEGVHNVGATPGDPQMMTKWLHRTSFQIRSSVTLLGAVQGTPGRTYEILFPSLEDVHYSSDPQPSSIAGGVFTFLPEPTSLMLLGLAGLVLRRR